MIRVIPEPSMRVCDGQSGGRGHLKAQGHSWATHKRAAPLAPLPFIQVFQKLIDALPEQIALVDEQWTILVVNPAWVETAALYGYDALGPGADYAGFCKARASEGHNAARPAVEGLAEINAGL